MPASETIAVTSDEMQAMVDLVTEVQRDNNRLKREIAKLRAAGRKAVRLGLDAADVIESEGFIADEEEIEDERDKLNRLGELFRKGRRHRG